MNNPTGIILGVIVGVAVGGFGGYTAGHKAADGVSTKQVDEMMHMMMEDGGRMEKMGMLMVEGGTMLEERGTKLNDPEMISKGKDLKVSGEQHQKDGRSMMEGDMMGMTSDGKIMDMPGMDHHN